MLDRARPRTLLGLLAHLLRLRGVWAAAARGRVTLALLGLVGVVTLASALACPGPRVRVATFNIRNFPENRAQIEGAFEIIETLDVPLVAVQEINDPIAFAAAAERHLGTHWQAEFGLCAEAQPRLLLPGVLFDERRYALEYARCHEQTQIDGNGRPTLEVGLRSRDRGPSLRVFVVHLKSGGAHADTRRRQLRGLTPIVRRAVGGEHEVVVLGDFNATGPADAETLARFADDTDLHWATQSLPCTAYWRPKGKCSGSALDHVFTSGPPRGARARGPCESVGCEPGDSCPIFYDQVSDHCPVTAVF